MHLQGIKIEYFITGGIALFWFLMALQLWVPLTNDAPEQKVEIFSKTDNLNLFLIPLAYILGMIVDYVARFSLNPIGDKIEKNIYASFNSKKFSELKNSSINLFVIGSNPELYKEIEVRLTRYRIARGFVINAVLIVLLLIITAITGSQKLSIAANEMSIGVAIGVLTALGIISFFMWKRFLTSYYKQQIFILQFLEKNNSSEK